MVSNSAAKAANTNKSGAQSPELISKSSKHQGGMHPQQRQRSPHPAQQQQARRGVFTPGYVKRMAQAKERGDSNTGVAPSKSNDAAPKEAQTVAQQINRAGSSASSMGKKSATADRYGIVTVGTSLSSQAKMSQNDAQSKRKNIPEPLAIPSLLSIDDESTYGAIDAGEKDIAQTELYKKFEEAFNMTLRNNPGILPGAPAVIDSIKKALFSVQKSMTEKEKEMRKELNKVKSEKDQLEAQLRKEMGTAAQRKNELSKELEMARSQKTMQQDVLDKEMAAIKAVKKELTARMSDVTKEKEELTRHLSILSKSRAELEHALDSEMKLVEKDRDALQKVVEERKKLQKQKMENKELEGKIERMTQAASKEKKALQAEVDGLKKFEEHMHELKKQNEESHQSLERERGQLKEIAETMQLKKATLQESKSELEVQYQKEIDELNGKIESTKLMHEKDMEMMVQSRVMNYFQGVCGGAERNGGVNGNVATSTVTGEKCMDGLDCADINGGGFCIDSLIKARVDAELQSRSSQHDSEEGDAAKNIKANEDELERRLVAEEMKRKSEAEASMLEEELKRKIEAEEMRLEEELKRKIEAEQTRLEAELKRKMELQMKMMKDEGDDNSSMENQQSESDDGASRVNGAHKSKLKKKNDMKKKEAMMKKEIDALREEIELVRMRNVRDDNLLRTPRTPTVTHFRRGGDFASNIALREEIRSLREEIKKGHATPRTAIAEQGSQSNPAYLQGAVNIIPEGAMNNNMVNPMPTAVDQGRFMSTPGSRPNFGYVQDEDVTQNGGWINTGHQTAWAGEHGKVLTTPGNQSSPAYMHSDNMNHSGQYVEQGNYFKNHGSRPSPAYLQTRDNVQKHSMTPSRRPSPAQRDDINTGHQRLPTVEQHYPARTPGSMASPAYLQERDEDFQGRDDIDLNRPMLRARERNSGRARTPSSRPSPAYLDDTEDDIREREDISHLRLNSRARTPGSRTSPAYLDETEDDMRELEEIKRSQAKNRGHLMSPSRRTDDSRDDIGYLRSHFRSSGKASTYSYDEQDDDIVRRSPPPSRPHTSRNRLLKSGGRRSLSRYDEDDGWNRSSLSRHRHNPRDSGRGRYGSDEDDVVERMHLATPPIRRDKSSGRSRYYL